MIGLALAGQVWQGLWSGTWEMVTNQPLLARFRSCCLFARYCSSLAQPGGALVYASCAGADCWVVAGLILCILGCMGAIW